MDIEDLPHYFSKKETEDFRHLLLAWYHENKRDLPWRKDHFHVTQNPSQLTSLEPGTKQISVNVKNETDELTENPAKKKRCIEKNNLQQRGYEVWVSEIMLQQTQVATVIPYYQRWMKEWPTVQDLANADLEKVNQVWAGLGYYSRAKRLHEGAKLICNTMNGQMPMTAKELEKLLPGIGPYTSGAIASIAFNEPSPLVDGNVIRVLSRVRAIGGNPKAQLVIQLYWKLASDLLTGETYPGHFNQAMMELGALVCTSNAPKCDTCPVQKHCQSYHLRPSTSMACECDVCKTWQEPVTSFTVLDYPRKPKKKAPKEMQLHVLLLHHQARFLLQQRSNDSWLAGLWEFPHWESKAQLETWMRGGTAQHTPPLQRLGEYVHLFSHIKQHFTVYYVQQPLAFQSDAITDAHHAVKYQWVNEETLSKEAVSKGMMKAFELYQKQKIWLKAAIKKKVEIKKEESHQEETRVLRSKSLNKDKVAIKKEKI